MASWHLFMQGWLHAFLLPRLGAFSLYREGLDRESLKFAIDVLARAERPLIVFPEGVVTRTNDRLGALMEGSAFLARNAARQRAAQGRPGRIVIHPLVFRYFFRGDLPATLGPALDAIEKRFSWRPRTGAPLQERILKIGEALLTLKELEYGGRPQTSLDLHQRRLALIERLLAPLEMEWLNGRKAGDVVSRVKSLRTAILPEMAAGTLAPEERARRWEQIADTYLAQQVSLYPAGYFDAVPTPEQLLETVERFEEDLTDVSPIHGPLHMVAEVGEAIEVEPARERKGEPDPLMERLREAMAAMLARQKENHRNGAHSS